MVTVDATQCWRACDYNGDITDVDICDVCQVDGLCNCHRIGRGRNDFDGILCCAGTLSKQCWNVCCIVATGLQENPIAGLREWLCGRDPFPCCAKMLDGSGGRQPICTIITMQRINPNIGVLWRPCIIVALIVLCIHQLHMHYHQDDNAEQYYDMVQPK